MDDLNTLLVGKIEALTFEVFGMAQRMKRMEQHVIHLVEQQAALVRFLAEEEPPAEARSLDGDSFSTRERDPSLPL